MAILFGYTEATNIVVQTGGTAGTPATFDDFVTADRGGQANLLPATASAVNMTLTYQIRPVEDLALQLKFLLAGTSAGAGDTLDITGTDWRGAAQVESINVAAGNGTYTGAKYWHTITDIDCTGWADGTLQVTQPQWGVIWDYGNGQYLIECRVDFGNGIASTYFSSEDEQVVIDQIVMAANAYLNIGRLEDGQPTHGSFWILANNPYWSLINGVMGIYSSIFRITGGQHFLFSLECAFNDSILEQATSGKNIEFGHANITVKDVRIIGGQFFINVTPSSIDGIIRDHSEGFADFSNQGGGNDFAIAERTQIENSSHPAYQYGLAANSGLILLNPITKPSAAIMFLNNDGSWIKEQYRCNIHIADKDGTNLASVSVLIQDTNNNIISYFDSDTDLNEVLDKTETDIDVDDGTKFTAGDYILIDNEWMLVDSILINTLTVTRGQYGLAATVHANNSDIYIAGASTTDANGDIIEQIITYRQWVTNAKILTTHSPHKFTISKAGYETMVLDEITVDNHIVWHEELLPVLAEGDVRDGVIFGEDGEGDLEIPSEDDVEDGVGFGSNGVEFEGNFEAPAEEDVEIGVDYGAGGVEFEGTYLGLTGNNLNAELERSVEMTGYLQESVELVGYLEESVSLIGVLTS